MSPEPPERVDAVAGTRPGAGRWRRLAAVSVALLAVTVVALGVTVARRPARLESVDPSDGARLAAPPAAVTLSFSGRVAPREVHVAVVGEAGRLATGPVRVQGRTVTVPLPPSGPGSYRLGYHVLLGDGREVSGQTGYRIGDGGAPPGAAAPAGPAVSGGHDHLGSGPWTVAVLLIGTMLTGFTLAVLLRQPRRRGGHRA